MMADPTASRLGPVLRTMWADGPRGLFRGNLATVGQGWERARVVVCPVTMPGREEARSVVLRLNATPGVRWREEQCLGLQLWLLPQEPCNECIGPVRWVPGRS